MALSLLTNFRQPAPGERRPTRGNHAIRWIEAHCVYTVGKWAGKPAVLLPWERRFIRALLSVDRLTGLRVYRWALLGIPKKNGKTELASWLALYMLIGDGELSAWVACAASSDYQADLVFGAAKRCVEWSPTLSRICEAWEKEITVPSLPGAKLVRVAAVVGANDGPSWHFVVCDEFHEWAGKKGRDTHTVLTNGIGAREQPLILQVTTAGWDLDGTVAGEHYELGLALVDDPSVDPRYLFWWYQADLSGADDCPACLDPRDDAAAHAGCWRDWRVWRDANPSWDITLPNTRAYLEDQLNKKTESVFKRYFLNLWVLSEDLWLPDGAWQRCRVRDLAGPGLVDGFDGRSPLMVGIDGGLKRDSFAVVACQWRDLDGARRLVARNEVWRNPYPPGHSAHGRWKLNLGDPLARLRELRDAYPAAALEGVPGPAFAYDPRFLEYPSQGLTMEGLNMIEFPQTDARMCPASETTYGLVLSGVLAHDGDPEFERQVLSSVQKQRESGWRISRPTGGRKNNDSGVALAMACALASRAEEEPEDLTPSVW
jgi:phage terminase large subunit-like protein